MSVDIDPSRPLADRVVVVVGGTSGMGLSAGLAVQRAGGRLVAVGRDDDHMVAARASLAGAELVVGDACEPGTAEAALERAVERFGGCDAIYHVAGASGRSRGDGPIHEVSDDGIAFTLHANLTSALLTNRAAARYFLHAGRPGSVLNLASVAGYSPSPRFFGTHVYAAAKEAIIGLTRSCAAYYAPQQVRFNAIAPGVIRTPMSRRAVGDDAIVRFLETKQPLGEHVGQPEHLDAAVVYFLSDQSCFVTGQVLAIDGGWTVSEGQAPG